MWKEPVTA